MAYNKNIERPGVEALMPEDAERDIIKETPEASVVMQLGRRLPNMSRKQRRTPVTTALAHAYWVNGDNGLKQTTEAEWANTYLNAEELAVIVPIPEAVLDDADYDIWAEVKPQISEAFGQKFDLAVLRGIEKPDSWGDDIKTLAAAAGHVVDISTVTGGGGDLYDAILSEGGLLSYIEEDGYGVNGHIASMSMKAKLRGLRDENGQPIFMRTMSGGQNVQEKSRYELDGETMHFPKNGSMDGTDVEMFSGDWNRLVWAIRQEITYKVLTEAVITDATGRVILNLAQQDMVALRAVIRIAMATPNPANRMNEDETTRSPFATLVR